MPPTREHPIGLFEHRHKNMLGAIHLAVTMVLGGCTKTPCGFAQGPTREFMNRLGRQQRGRCAALDKIASDVFVVKAVIVV